jgi:exopolysaccharide biosynthesis polyprenyl glycosylphosphotransferase
MKSRTTTNFDVLIMIGSIITTEAMLILAMLVRQTLPFGQPLLPGADKIPPLLYPIVGAIWFVMLLIFSVPRLVRMGHLLEGLWRLFAAVALAALTTSGTLFFSFRLISRLFVVYFVVFDLLALLLLYGLMRLIVRRTYQAQAHGRVLIAGAGRTGLHIARAIAGQWNGAAPIVGFLDIDPTRVGAELEGRPILGTLDDALAIIKDHEIEEIIITLPLEAHPQAVNLVRQLQAAPLHIRLVPDFLDFAVMRASVDYLEGLPVVGLRVPALSEEARFVKRLFDITVSALLLIILAPIMAVIAVLIRLDTPGPEIYQAERIGESGRLFRMYKFRTMVRDAETRWNEITTRGSDGKLAFKQPDDPRITRMGRWLRRTSLDELPQLFNVLKGDMSLVGPRPELPVVVQEEYEPWQWSRFTVPQGMTGWWQVNRRGYAHQHLCTADDLYYIQNYSLLLDIQILLRTVLVVLTGQGAY